MTAAHSDGFAALLEVFEDEIYYSSTVGLAEHIWEHLAMNGYVIVKSNEKKLNPHQVRAIRSKHKLGDTQAELAAFYEVNPATISRIVRGYYH